MSRRKETVAAALTRATGKTWTAFREEGDWGWRYRCEDGREVHRCGEPVLGIDGYSDAEFVTVYYDQWGFRYGGMPWLIGPSEHDLAEFRRRNPHLFPKETR